MTSDEQVRVRSSIDFTSTSRELDSVAREGSRMELDWRLRVVSACTKSRPGKHEVTDLYCRYC